MISLRTSAAHFILVKQLGVEFFIKMQFYFFKTLVTAVIIIIIVNAFLPPFH